LVFKLNRTTSNSKAKLIEHKIEHLLSQRKQGVINTLKTYSKYIASKQVVAEKMLNSLHQLFTRKYNMYNIFYMLKNTTKYQTGRYNHLKLAVFNLERVLSKTAMTVLKTYFAQISSSYLKDTLKSRKLKLEMSQHQSDIFIKLPKFKNVSDMIVDVGVATSHHELPAMESQVSKPYDQKIKFNTNNNLERHTLEISSPHLLKKARKLNATGAPNKFQFSPIEIPPISGTNIAYL
jgi:hypothetical protein